ncbi:unnamed protein product, partial [Sphacelaria rigidula]
VISGSKLEVFFCDPVISSGDIWGFLVQWDTDDGFENALQGNDTGAGCFENGYGSCVVQDATIAGQCPYSLLISGLNESEASMRLITYYIRVSALGDVAPQSVSPTGEPPDNTNWSGVLEAIPADQPPSSPGPVSLYVLNGSTLQVKRKRRTTIDR